MDDIFEVNIKMDMPSASVAVDRVREQIKIARKLNFRAVKIIHGYGSTGRGGKIRTVVRTFLGQETDAGCIRGFITGEDFSIFDERTRRAFLSCGGLRKDRDLDRHNNGITIILL
jgi:hypothetical protein